MACPTGKLVVDSKDPRINYNLLPGEELMTCPYNLSHAIRPIKFAKHVFNCHRLHCKEQAAKNAEPLFAMCQYDRSHHCRKEELAHHEANCEARFDTDDWGWGDDKGAASTSYSIPAGIKVELPKPPEIDEETKKVMESTEEWEIDENAPKFDADKRIHQLRLQGYRLNKSYEAIGLTKSEKREFYKQESETLKKYERINFLDRMRENCSSALNAGTVERYGTPSSSCASKYGINLVDELDNILEEEKESID